jgi:hypothetical protein
MHTLLCKKDPAIHNLDFHLFIYLHFDSNLQWKSEDQT